MSKKNIIKNYCRKRRGKNTRITIPFNLLCTECKYTLPKSKKIYVNRILSEETYLSVPIYLFEFPCYNCGKNIVFKTDPKAGDYKPFLNCKIVNNICENESFDKKINKSNLSIEELKEKELKNLN
ncbi:hypothetical protein TUBRATIS_15510 [Tubulinosema ratisbonensis]|uniref:Uncharacterized protein n=1 Tax=Tubulinosema ratisbonensis TaxID=291195 RepID=A0A437ALH6_9MICR|nr:hypothetical protein TUBRATIS_15510 [Tubulinosema ratisbonensis]